MNSTMPQYEMRYFNETDWVPISEKSTLECLFTNSVCVSQIIDELLRGKEITCRDAAFRIRNFKFL